jgi:hypothetical protein
MTTVVGVYSSGANAIAATLSDPESKLPNYTLTVSVWSGPFLSVGVFL